MNKETIRSCKVSGEWGFIIKVYGSFVAFLMDENYLET